MLQPGSLLGGTGIDGSILYEVGSITEVRGRVVKSLTSLQNKRNIREIAWLPRVE